MQSRHARRRIHHVCACRRGKRTRWYNRGGPARGVRLPLSTPLRYQPRLDIINVNAIFSSAVQFRVPLSRIRSFVLARRSLNSSPSPGLPPVRISFFLSSSVWSAPFIYLSPPAPLSASVILYTFRSSYFAVQSSEWTSVAFSPFDFRSRRVWAHAMKIDLTMVINVTQICGRYFRENFSVALHFSFFIRETLDIFDF